LTAIRPINASQRSWSQNNIHTTNDKV